MSRVRQRLARVLRWFRSDQGSRWALLPPLMIIAFTATTQELDVPVDATTRTTFVLAFVGGVCAGVLWQFIHPRDLVARLKIPAWLFVIGGPVLLVAPNVSIDPAGELTVLGLVAGLVVCDGRLRAARRRRSTGQNGALGDLDDAPTPQSEGAGLAQRADAG